jgi:ABC-type sugar transport system ATPase subunit
MTSSQVKLDSVSKSFGDLTVIDSISLSVPEGDFLVLLGPSGCGKSTLLRMIAGLETISDGELTIAEVRANETHPRDRNIAMVFQNYALYPHMSIAENIAYPLKLAGISKAARAAKVNEVSSLLELQDLLDRKPAQLSGGQRQRVAMGRALVRDPSLFLMDEPLSNLDARLRQQMRKDIKALHEKLKVTTLYVTHDQIEAMTMADKVVLLNKGRVQQVGTPKQIYAYPENLFVARFIGNPAMNIVDDTGTCRTISRQIFGESEGEENVTLGFRPEVIKLLGEVEQDNAEIQLPTVVEQVEMLGSESLCHLVHNSVAGVEVRLVAKISGDQTSMKGAHVTASIQPKDIHFFNRETGQRISVQ